MFIRKGEIIPLLRIIRNLQPKKFDIQTQYKFLKLKKTIESEYELFKELIYVNTKDFLKDDNETAVLQNLDSFTIKQEHVEDFKKILQEIEDSKVSIPDIYFSLDELENLELTMEELEPLMNFIK